jgi:hypothetical protein
MNAKRNLSPPIAVALAAVLSACGSSAPSKKAFITKADAICARGDTQTRAVPLPPTSGLTKAQVYAKLGSYIDEVVPVAQNVVGQIKALDQPSDNQALLHRYYAALDDGIAKLRALSAAAKHADTRALESAIAALRSSQSAQLARQYGFKDCATSTGATA